MKSRLGHDRVKWYGEILMRFKFGGLVKVSKLANLVPHQHLFLYGMQLMQLGCFANIEITKILSNLPSPDYETLKNICIYGMYILNMYVCSFVYLCYVYTFYHRCYVRNFARKFFSYFKVHVAFNHSFKLGTFLYIAS